MPPDVEDATKIIGRPVSVIGRLTGGFTGGTKLILVDADGRRYFAKSAASETWAAGEYRAEGRAHRWLPAEASGDIFIGQSAPNSNRTTLVFQAIDGGTSDPIGWESANHVKRAVEGLNRIYYNLDAAAPDDLASSTDNFWASQSFWREAPRRPEVVSAKEATHFAALEGRVGAILNNPGWKHEVSHEDLRRDNLLIPESGDVVAIDWGLVSRTPRLVDAVTLGINLKSAGHDPNLVFMSSGPFHGLFSGEEVASILSSACGYYHASLYNRDGKPQKLIEAHERNALASLNWLRNLIDL